MPQVFTYEFDSPVYKGNVSSNTGIYVNGQFTDGSDGTTINVINPATGKVSTSVSEATPKDVDIAVEAAQKAFDTAWGLNAPGSQRSFLLGKLSRLLEEHAGELAALEALNNGKTFKKAKEADVASAIDVLRYYAGWADRISRKAPETSEDKLTYTRHEPIGVVGQIIPWNFPRGQDFVSFCELTFTIHCSAHVVLKFWASFGDRKHYRSQALGVYPADSIACSALINEAGFPPGVVNILTGHGNTVGNAISHHIFDVRGCYGATKGEAIGMLRLTPAQYDDFKILAFDSEAQTWTLIPDAQIWPRALNSYIGGSSDAIHLIVSTTSQISYVPFSVLGQTFLQRYYGVFDSTNKPAVGFAATEFTNSTTNFNSIFFTDIIRFQYVETV